MITAIEAREICKTSIIKHLKFIEKEIIDAANENYCAVIIKEEPYSDLYFLMPNIAKEILRTLKCYGFEARFFYDKEGEYVDSGLLISWGDAVLVQTQEFKKNRQCRLAKKWPILTAIDRLSRINRFS